MKRKIIDWMEIICDFFLQRKNKLPINNNLIWWDD
jgi:hypothetical protein